MKMIRNIKSLLSVPLGKYILLAILLVIGIAVISRKNKQVGTVLIIVCFIGFACFNILTFYLTFNIPLVYMISALITFIPMMYFSFKLNRVIIVDTKTAIPAFNVFYKSIATILIWYIAFFPLSKFLVVGIITAPQTLAERQEREEQNQVLEEQMAEQKEAILKMAPYADLTEFGLGIYVLEEEGDKIIWDITQPKNGNNRVYGDSRRELYAYHQNEASEVTFDDSQRGKDVYYDILLYESTYIIITPTTYRSYEHLPLNYYIYLCKELSAPKELFQIVTKNEEAITQLLAEPCEKIHRRELVELLGITQYEDVERSSK